MVDHQQISLGDDCYLDLKRRSLFKDGLRISLSNTQFDLLHCLALNSGKVVTTKQLINFAWGDESLVETNQLYVYINRIRERLEDNKKSPKCLISLRKSGYILYPRVKKIKDEESTRKCKLIPFDFGMNTETYNTDSQNSVLKKPLKIDV